MITNTGSLTFDVIGVTNELPKNRLGGVGSVIENLMSGFRSLGVNILWFLVDHNYRDHEVLQLLKEDDQLAVGTYEDLKYFRAPVIHLHAYNHNPDMLSYMHDKKVVFTLHSLQVCEEQSNNVDMPDAVKRQESFIAACDEVVLISRSELGKYHKLGYHKLNPKASVIYNGVRDTKKFRNLRSNKIIGFCGRLVPRKHPEYAQFILDEKGFEAYGTKIAGRGFSTYARDLLSGGEFRERVQYLGWCGGFRLAAFYDAVDVLAIPSIYEPFGMVALEAVIHGIPIVCTPVDGLVEILGDYAFYSRDDTYEAFRDAMYSWLRADNKTIDEKTRGAFERYKENFTDVRMAQRYQEHFTRPHEGVRL
jgi:glycosyltransferase involved in cell wall biosynthesis